MARKTVAQLDEEVQTLTEQVEALQAQVKKLFATAGTPRHRTSHQERRTAHACDATDQCPGHPTEKYVEMHRAQVAAKAAKAS